MHILKSQFLASFVAENDILKSHETLHLNQHYISQTLQVQKLC